MAIVVVGLDQRTAALDLRERLALSDEKLRGALNDVRELPGIQEAVILSTCNRLEIYAESDAAEATAAYLEQLIALSGDLTAEALRPHLYRLEDAAAIRHLLRVAAGLESMMLGESQVLGQVGEAAEIAQSENTSGAILSHLFAQAVHAGKRVRSETEISRHTTSISHAAARLARERSSKRVLVVGAGEMAALAAQALAAQEAHEITIINRTYEKAAALARQVGGRALDWLQFGAALEWADAVICATSAAQAILHAADFASRERPLLVIDIGVPRNVDMTTLPHLTQVELWTIDDLQAQVDANLAQRSTAIPAVEAIVEHETGTFLDWLHSREVAPVITDLQRWARGVAESEITQAMHRLDTPDARTEQVITRMAHRLVSKLLHEPTVRLKLHAAEGDGQDYAEALRDLFGLEIEDDVHVQ